MARVDWKKVAMLPMQVLLICMLAPAAVAILPLAFFFAAIFMSLRPPIVWRLRWKKFDDFWCRLGLHRCMTVCGRGCCDVCMNCGDDGDHRVWERAYGRVWPTREEVLYARANRS